MKLEIFNSSKFMVWSLVLFNLKQNRERDQGAYATKIAGYNQYKPNTTDFLFRLEYFPVYVRKFCSSNIEAMLAMRG